MEVKRESLNVPYVKKYVTDENGVRKVSNTIVGSYKSEFPNRRSRHEAKNKVRFYGESKNTHLSVTPQGRYLRVIQIEKEKDGSLKRIEHYILQK